MFSDRVIGTKGVSDIAVTFAETLGCFPRCGFRSRECKAFLLFRDYAIVARQKAKLSIALVFGLVESLRKIESRCLCIQLRQHLEDGSRSRRNGPIRD